MEMASQSADRVLLLGPLQVIRNGVALHQPPSRKVRALLAYLAMAPRPVTREKLCELFWDVADDPKSELRWCLSKLRPLVDRPAAPRIVANRKQVSIETGSLDIDALSVARHAQRTMADASPSELRSLLALFRGDFLEGLSVDGAPSFENWLAGQRHRFGQLRQQLLERLSSVLPPESDDRIEVLRECIDVAPFDEAVHIELVRTLLRRGLHAEAQRQIDASLTRFRAEGIDPDTLAAAFAAARRPSRKPAAVSLVDAARFDAPPIPPAADTRGPTLLLLPFTAAPENVADADSVTSDIIFGFAKLRSISVIARGTAFSLRNLTPSAAAALVNAQYVASGHLRRDGKKYLVSVELIDPKSDRIFWVDEFSCNADDFLSAPPLLAARIVSASMRKFTSSNATARYSVRRPRSTPGKPIIAASPACGVSPATAIARPNTSSIEPSRSTRPSREAMLGLSFTHFHNAFHLNVRESERESRSPSRPPDKP